MSSSFHPYQTFFGYSGSEKYIKLVQRDPNQNTVDRCFLLDQDLSIIAREQGREIQVQPANCHNQEEDSPFYSTIIDKEKQYTFKRAYQKHPQITDLLIGRQNWGRIQNAIKIDSDAVSRDHTRIFIQLPSQNKLEFLTHLQTAIETAAQRSSKWRKLPKHLLEMIAEYIIPQPSYWIQDCSSRNGTYLIDFEPSRHEIKLQEAYQFDGEPYEIKVLQNIQRKGTQISRLLQEYEPNFTYYSTKYVHNEVIFPHDMTREALLASEEKYRVLLVECDVSNQLKYLHWIINRNEDSIYSIGEGQMVNVNYTLHSTEIKRHGYIVFEQGKWYIMGIGPQYRVWVKLEPNVAYPLDKQHYKIMVAHQSVLQLQFHNFG